MIVEQEAYVSLSTAQLLKEAGFNWLTHDYYDFSYSRGRVKHSPAPCNWNAKPKTFSGCSAPTQQMALRWLREVKYYNIEVKILSITSGFLCWYYKLYKLDFDNIYRNVEFVTQSPVTVDTYEQALEDGIKKCLTFILEKEHEE